MLTFTNLRIAFVSSSSPHSQLSAKPYYSQSEECLLHAPASSMYVVPEAVRLEVTLTFTPGVVWLTAPTLIHFTPGVSAEFATLTSFVLKIKSHR